MCIYEELRAQNSLRQIIFAKCEFRYVQKGSLDNLVTRAQNGRTFFAQRLAGTSTLQPPIANRRWDTYMVVIVSVSKLHNGRIQVAVAKPQHNSKPVQSYVSEEEAREVLLGLGVADETADYYLFKLFPQLSVSPLLLRTPH
jgi:hypothetical protein